MISQLHHRKPFSTNSISRPRKASKSWKPTSPRRTKCSIASELQGLRSKVRHHKSEARTLNVRRSMISAFLQRPSLGQEGSAFSAACQLSTIRRWLFHPKDTTRPPARMLATQCCCRGKCCARPCGCWPHSSENCRADADRICRLRCIATGAKCSTAPCFAVRNGNSRSRASNSSAFASAPQLLHGRTTFVAADIRCHKDRDKSRPAL